MVNLKKINVKHVQTMEERLNTLRAGVLGANDGILTVVGVLFSVAAATSNQFTIMIAGLSDLLACAFSMASGEYASVSMQKDTEKSAVTREEMILQNNFSQQTHIVTSYYVAKGLSEKTATNIAKYLLAKKPLKTVVNVKYGIELGHYLDPWYAAVSSLVAASSGGAFPLLAMTLTPTNFKMIATIIAVTVSVALTGLISSKLGNGLVKQAIIRNIVIGLITMCIHYYVGQLF